MDERFWNGLFLGLAVIISTTFFVYQLLTSYMGV